MRVLIGLFLLVLPVSFASAQVAPAPLAEDDPVYRDILRTERERMDAYVRQDLDYLAGSFADEYLHTNLRGGTTTKAEELAFYGTPDFSLEGGDVGAFTMRRYGDVVVATGTVTWHGARYRQADLSGDFRVTRVYVQRDGRWLLAASHASKVGG